MAIHRAYLEAEKWHKDETPLPEEESHYLLDVLRMREGDAVELFDGTGREARAQVAEIRRGAGRSRSADARVILRILESRQEPAPRPEITLLQAVPKPARMDWIIEKATELGVREIIPIVSRHVVAISGSGDGEEKVGRWRRIALSAARQCQTAWLPTIAPLHTVAQAIGEFTRFEVVLMGGLLETSRPFHQVMDELRGRRLRRIALLIGPEGDFSPEEYSDFMAHGAQPVSFGPRVLRVETAALYGLSALVYERGGE